MIMTPESVSTNFEVDSSITLRYTSEGRFDLSVLVNFTYLHPVTQKFEIEQSKAGKFDAVVTHLHLRL